MSKTSIANDSQVAYFHTFLLRTNAQRESTQQKGEKRTLPGKVLGGGDTFLFFNHVFYVYFSHLCRAEASRPAFLRSVGAGGDVVKMPSRSEVLVR